MTPIETMSAAVLEHKPVRIFAMFSGGNDSMVSTHFAMEHGAHEVLHINTGIGIRQTREFVRETCKAFGWPLREEHPPNGNTYRDLVLSMGFPGPGFHRIAYDRLKGRAVAKVIRESKQKRTDRIALITGLRNLESARRMGYSQPCQRIGAQLWIAPMFWFSKIDLSEYRKLHHLPVSAVAKNLGMSGECLCGAFASPGEFERIERYYPEAAQEIRILQDEAKAAGKHCSWGSRPNPGAWSEDLPFMPMCVSCPTKPFLEAIL